MDPDQPAKLHCLIRDFAVQKYTLQYPFILQEDSKDSDQTVLISNLI